MTAWADALASATPDRRRSVMPGYHAVTFGALVAELTTRVTGMSFTDLVRTEIAEPPLGIREFWFQVPDEERRRIAKLFPPDHSLRNTLGGSLLRLVAHSRAEEHRRRRHAGRIRRTGPEPPPSTTT